MNASRLKKQLDALYRTYDRAYLATDPLKFLHEYSEPADIEVVGLVCAVLAYGQVPTIQRSIRRVLEVMGAHPAQYVLHFDAKAGADTFSNFSHRFNRGNDIVLLLHYMRRMIEEYGSVGGFFRAGYDSSDATIERALCSFMERTLQLDCAPVYPQGSLPKDASVRFFFPSPRSGSACKRLCLYLRWLVRRADGLDMGIWDFVSPAQLVIPLDVHIARICSRIGLTKRKTTGWAMALEITENLRRLDSADPVKYDFSLSRLGILDKCAKVPSEAHCQVCEIRGICVEWNNDASRLRKRS